MGITTYTELKSAIADFLNRDDLSSAVDTFIDLAEARMQREIRHYKMEETAQLSASSRYTSLPTDFLQPIRIDLDSNKASLEPASREFIQTRRYENDDATGRPRFYAITDGQLELFPTPGEAMTVNLLYYEKITPLDDSNASNWLLTDAPDAYLYGSLVHTAPYLSDDQRTNTWAALYQSSIDELHLSSERTKWGGPLNLRPAKYG